MSMTKEQVHEKIRNLIHHDQLTIRASAVYLPLSIADQYVTDDLQMLRLIIDTYSFLGLFKIPNIGKNLKQSLTVSNQYKIQEKYNLDKYSQHGTLKMICQYAEKEWHWTDSAQPEIKLSEYFERYMNSHLYDIKSKSEFNATLLQFFKYMPYFHEVLMMNEELDSFGYCCEDCDGPYSEYVKSQFANEIYKIKNKLDKVKIDYNK